MPRFNHIPPLTLPQHIAIGTSAFRTIDFLYTAGGVKLQKSIAGSGNRSAPTDYLGSMVYPGDADAFIFTSEGRALRNDNGVFDYEYFLKDHLGNTRVSFNQKGTILQDNSYYPFGMGLGESLTYVDNTATENKYKYNGKELQDDFGLGWYDYGARMYDAELGRWHVMDPMADDAYSWSSYNANWNNPILNLDIDGKWANPVFSSDGNYRGNTVEGYTGEVIIYDGNKDFNNISAAELLYDESFNVSTQRGDANTYDKVRGELSGDSKSKIWTHIASNLEGQQIYDEKFSMSTLSDGKISCSLTDAGSWNSRIKSKTITGTDKYKYETTVENIQSSIIVHEWYSHIQKGNTDDLKSHRLAYKNVINYKNLWDKTTKAYKGFNVRQLLKYTKDETKRTTVDRLYINLYNTYKNEF